MSGATYRPGRLLHPEQGVSSIASFPLPGERAVPLGMLAAHWAGSSARLADWAARSGYPWIPGEGGGNDARD